MKRIDGITRKKAPAKTQIRTIGFTVPSVGQERWVFARATDTDLIEYLEILESNHIRRSNA